MTRRRLPNRRAAELYDLTFKGLRYTIGVSRFPMGLLQRPSFIPRRLLAISPTPRATPQ